MPNIIVKNYNHFNTAFPKWDTPKGVYVKSKDHYDRLMKENNMVTLEQAQELNSSKKMKEYKLSNNAKSILDAARMTKDAKGNVKLGDKTIDAMVKIGAIGKKIPSYMKLPKDHYNVGGFSK